MGRERERSKAMVQGNRFILSFFQTLVQKIVEKWWGEI